MFTPISIERGKSCGAWSVCLYHEESGKAYWLDANLNEGYHDIEIEWNQYIFYNTDTDDMERKAFQEDNENFDEASSEVICVLEREGEVFQGEDGDWYLQGEWKGAAVWSI